MAEVFYKFLSVENAFRVMEQHEIKVSLIRELNDIYDCEPVLGPAAGEPGYLSPSATENLSASIADNYGLLCFSKTYSSPLLWGHYAEQANGFALGFDPTQLVLPVKMDVDYRESRSVVKWPVDEQPDDQAFRRLMKEHFGVKAREWKYEEEVRFVVNLADCMPRTRMYFIRFALRALREVIIGPRSTIRPAYLRHFLASHYKGMGISLHTAHMHPERFEIESRPFPENQPFVS